MPWAKGQSGNPKGRGKHKPWRDALERALKRRDEGKEIGSTLERIADTVVGKALEGDKDAYKEIAERHDGKVPQGIIGGDEDDAPIKLVTRIELVAAKADDDSTD